MPIQKTARPGMWNHSPKLAEMKPSFDQGWESSLQTGGEPLTEPIKMGAILIKGTTLLPDSLLFESERVSNGWILVKNIDRYRLERRIRDAGWTFFAGRGELRQASSALMWKRRRAGRSIKLCST